MKAMGPPTEYLVIHTTLVDGPFVGSSGTTFLLAQLSAHFRRTAADFQNLPYYVTGGFPELYALMR